jgi:prepilin-type N-terminal cleavage/methylation domain-containing protein
MKDFSMNKNGFTIIELVVVVAIISVLASIVIANLGPARQKGKDSAIKTEMNQFYVPASEYYQAQGGYGGMFTRNNQGGDAATAAIKVQSIYNNLPAFLDCKTCAFKSDGTGWATCAVLNYPIDQSRAWCVDSNSVQVEICADQCTTSGLAPGVCPTISPPCHAPSGKNSCSGCAE